MKVFILLVFAFFGLAVAQEPKQKLPEQICASAPGPIQLGRKTTVVQLQCWDPHGHLTATTIPNNSTVGSPEVIRLEPGWKGFLRFQMNQTMTVSQNSLLLPQNVTVAPGHYYVEPERGIRVVVQLENGTQYATVYFSKVVFPPQIPVPGINLTASLVPQPGQVFQFENVTLYPGWTGLLRDPISQILIPGPNSNLAIQNVTVMPKIYIVEEMARNEAVRANAQFGDRREFVTIFFKNGKPLFTKQNLFTELIPQYNQTLFLAGNVTLSPGWVGILGERINQTLTPVGNSSQFLTQNVTVAPGWYMLSGYEGVRANSILSGGGTDFVTIFFENGQAKLNQNILNGSLVPQFNQNLFRFEAASLSPGWYGQLSAPTEQILVPASNSTQFEKQAVTVWPGWLEFQSPYSGIRASINNSINTIDYVTIFFRHRQNITRLEEINKTVKVV